MYKFLSPDCVNSKSMKYKNGNSLSYLSKTGIVNSLRNVDFLMNSSDKELYDLVNLCNFIILFSNESLDLLDVSPITNINERTFILKMGKAKLIIEGDQIKCLAKNQSVSFNNLFLKYIKHAVIHAEEVSEIISFRNQDLAKFRFQTSDSICLPSFNKKIDDLKVIKSIGEGGFCNVQLVKNEEDNNLYALKSYSNERLGNEISVENLNRECDILLGLDHPFVVKLIRPVQDSKSFHFLMEYIQGKELWSVMREINEFSTAMIKFFIACILVALDYLHSNSILYRDLKPENIMVNSKGYFKLVDFGIAKKLERNWTYTIIGTPHYMSPEMIYGTGYSYTTDYWSLAICLYEIVCGDVPFGSQIEDPIEIFRCIKRR